MLGYTLCLTSDGTHKDDPATNFHALVCLLGNEELTTGVDVEDTIKLLGLNIGEVTERNDTRIGAADVELAEVCDDIVHELRGLLDVANVGLEGGGVGAVAQCLDLLNDGLSALDGVGVVDCDLSTALGELNGHRLSDTTACGLLVWKFNVVTSKYCIPEPVTTATFPSKLHVCSIAAIVCVVCGGFVVLWCLFGRSLEGLCIEVMWMLMMIQLQRRRQPHI
jgi:hypothetical protein